MIHVGMNIVDKETFFSEAYRVTKPGGVFGIYDVMLAGHEELKYPLPWAAEKDGSAISSMEDYNSALTKAGFSLMYEDDKTDFAIDFFEKMTTTMNTSSGPPPIGLHLLIEKSTKEKITNMVQRIKSGKIAPKIIISKK
jgi:hypothetical protein